MNTVIKTGTHFNSKYGKKLTDIAIKTGKDFATIARKKIVHKSAESTGDLIGNKIADKITSASKKSHNEEIQSNEVNNEIPKERYIPPKESQKIIDELKLMEYNNGIPKNSKFDRRHIKSTI